MAKIVNIFSSADEDMKDYERKILKHKTAVFGKYLFLGAVLLVVVLGSRYYFNNRNFSSYSIVSTVERQDTMTTQYASFGKNILKYSRDGISYTDDQDHLLFSVTYTMQDPILALNDRAGAVADKNGNQIYTFDQEKQTGQIETLLPIKQVVVSAQGVVAVLMEEGEKAKLELYSSDGTLLGDGEFTLADAGYPMNLAISADGTKLVIAFAQVSGSKFNSCIAVYNFDNVGENYVDHLVFAKNYTDYLVPEVHYYDESTFSAVGDGILVFYQGSQIPELKKELTFEEEIQSVFYGEDCIGLVFPAEEGRMLKLYDMSGNEVAEIPFDLDYRNICIAEKGILIYNETEMGLYSYKGKECFRQTFDTALTDIFMTASRNKYRLIYTNETQLIKLQ